MNGPRLVDFYTDHCFRCGRPDGEHGRRPQDGPSYCGWTLAMVRKNRADQRRCR